MTNFDKGDRMNSEGTKAITLCAMAMVLGMLTINGSIFTFVGWVWAGFSHYLSSFLS
jgi:hypothetical protein